MNAIKAISLSSALLVTGLAALSFLISFHALADLAVQTGATPAHLSWAFPLVLDGAIIVFSCAALRSALLRESTMWPFSLVVLATVMSVALNVLHLEGTWLGKAMAAAPPLLLAMSIETIIRQIRSEIERKHALFSQGELENEKLKLLRDIEKLSDKRTDLKIEAETPKQAAIRERRETITRMKGEGAEIDEIADALKVSSWTVKRDLSALNGSPSEIT